MAIIYQEAEKFVKDVFWSGTHNKDNSLDIPGVIANRLVKDNQEKDPEYYEHREGVVHVSSLTKCLRGVVLEMLGAKKDNPPDARKLGVFKAGNLFEEYIVDALGDMVLDRQTEYTYNRNGIILTGRDDGTIIHNGEKMILEVKSVHSDSFWYREKEGTLVAWQNQIQLQTYLWLRWHLYGEKLNGMFVYVSKDDCTVVQAPVKYNPEIIEKIVLPTLDIITKAYLEKDPSQVPVPELAVFSESRNQWQKNWLATYCEHHKQCCGAGWELEASNLVTLRNQEQKAAMSGFTHQLKKEKPTITVEPK